MHYLQWIYFIRPKCVVENRQPECIFNLCDVRIAITCIVGVPQGSSLKLKKEVDFWGCSWLLPPSLPSSRTWPSLSGCHVLVFCWWSAPPPPSVLVRYNICTMLDHRHLGLCIWAMTTWHLYSLINILIENTTLTQCCFDAGPSVSEKLRVDILLWPDACAAVACTMYEAYICTTVSRLQKRSTTAGPSLSRQDGLG